MAFTCIQYIYLFFLYVCRELYYENNNNYCYYYIQPSNHYTIHVYQEPTVYTDNHIGYDIDDDNTHINAINDSYNHGIALRAPTETTVSAESA
jgi:hypothetical protein